MPQSGPEESSVSDSPLDTDRLEQLRGLLDEVHLRLLQQILASDSGALSVEELDYRNTDTEDRKIDYRLQKLADRGVVTKLKADNPTNDLPSTYWAVSDLGIQLLKRFGFYDEIGALSEADDALERTDRIRNIEAFDGRPSPNWYDSHCS